MRRHFVIASAVILALATSCFSMAQNNPFVGIWKLNVARSRYDPGPPPKGQTRTWESSGKVSIKGTDATGTSRAYGYTIKVDGKDYPTTGPIPNGAETVASKSIAANTVEATFKRGGKQVERTKFSVSKDGKLLTIVGKGITPNGQSFNVVMVWDKQ